MVAISCEVARGVKRLGERLLVASVVCCRWFILVFGFMGNSYFVVEGSASTWLRLEEVDSDESLSWDYFFYTEFVVGSVGVNCADVRASWFGSQLVS